MWTTPVLFMKQVYVKVASNDESSTSCAEADMRIYFHVFLFILVLRFTSLGDEICT